MDSTKLSSGLHIALHYTHTHTHDALTHIIIIIKFKEDGELAHAVKTAGAEPDNLRSFQGPTR